MSNTEYDDILNKIVAESEDTKAEAEDAKKDAFTQLSIHRNRLFILVCALTVASFVLLAFTVLFQMFWTIRHPEYKVISDMVINVLAVGVFAELVGVVGIIAKLLWK